MTAKAQKKKAKEKFISVKVTTGTYDKVVSHVKPLGLIGQFFDVAAIEKIQNDKAK